MYSPEQYSVFDFIVERFSFGIDGQQMLQIGIVRQIGVDPITERQLFLKPDRVRGSLAGCLGYSTQSLEILLLRNDVLERGTQFVGLQLLAQFLKFVERETTLVFQSLFIIVLLDHLTYFVAGHLEAANVQCIPQLGDINEAISV